MIRKVKAFRVSNGIEILTINSLYATAYKTIIEVTTAIKFLETNKTKKKDEIILRNATVLLDDINDGHLEFRWHTLLPSLLQVTSIKQLRDHIFFFFSYKFLLKWKSLRKYWNKWKFFYFFFVVFFFSLKFFNLTPDV